MAGAGQAIASGIVLLLLFRILIDRLGMEQIGIWALLMAWLSLGRIADMGIPGGIVKRGASLYAADKRAETYRIIFTGVILASISTAFFTAIISIVIWFIFHDYVTAVQQPFSFLVTAAIISWLSCMLVSMRAGIDAVSRVDLRHASVLIQNIILLILSYFIIKQHDLHSLLWAQLASVLLSVLLLLVLYQYRNKETNAEEKEKGVIRNLLSFGLPFQMSTIAGLLADPIVKLLLGTFSSLSVIGYYDLSLRLIGQMRSVLVSAAEALFPYAARLSLENDHDVINKAYFKAYRMNLLVSSLGFSLLIAIFPILSLIWFSYFQPTFLLCGTILAYTAWISVLVVPAYFFVQGIGIQKWNVFAHLTITLGTVFCGGALGIYYQEVGILIGVLLATALGNSLILYGINKYITAKVEVENRIPLFMIIPPVIAVIPIVYSLQFSTTYHSGLICCVIVSALLVLAFCLQGDFKTLIANMREKMIS